MRRRKTYKIIKATATTRVSLWQRLRIVLRLLDKPEHFFLVAGGIFVVLFCFINPPFQAVDEQVHFYRIAELGEGHLVSRKISVNNTTRYGDIFPTSMVNSVNELLGSTTTPNHEFDKHILKINLGRKLPATPTVSVPFEGSAVYSPVTYLPHIVGYDLARLFTQSVAIRMYASRLGDAICWLLLVWLAIKLTPIGKWSFAAFGLMPQIVFSASTLQADAFNIGLCFLLVALILHLRISNKVTVISYRLLLALLAIMSAIALSKFAYVPLLFLVLLIPRSKLKYPYILYAILLGIPIVLSLVWEYIVRNIAARLDAILNGVSYGPKKQLQYSIHHPLTMLHAFANSIFSGASDHLLREMLGVFTWFYLQVPLGIQLVTVATILVALLYQLGRFPVIALSRKLFATALLIITALLVFVTFYFLWTPVGANIVLGVQGRYFLPLLPVLPILFTGRKRILNISQQTFARIIQIGSLTGLVTTFIILANRFY